MENNQLNSQQSSLISLVFFGRLEERKGLCTFISAIKSLPRLWQKKINIIFMGKVVQLYSAELKHLNSEQYIEQELGEDFTYKIISNFFSQQAIDYIRNLNHAIVCLTSPQENFPNTALEMGQLPVSIVVSDTGGFRETLSLVERNEGLYWFKPKDVDSLTEKIEEALKNFPETPQVTTKDTLENINQKLLEEKIAYINKAFSEIKSPDISKSKVTIGVISQNQGEYLLDCLSCLENQTYPDLEIIVVDDKSSNSDKDYFIQAESLFPQFKFISLDKSKGVGAIRNHLLEISSGDYFLFFSPQVRLYPMAIEKFLLAAINSSAKVVTSAQKEVGGVDRVVSYSGGTLPTMMKNNAYGGECCLFSREILQKFPFTEDKEINTQNWEILTACVVTGENITYYPYPLYEYYVKEAYNLNQEMSAKAKYSLRQYLAKISPSQWTSRQIYMLMTAVQQLQDLPSQMANLQHQLQESKEKLSRCQNFIKQLENNNSNSNNNVSLVDFDDESFLREIQAINNQLQEAKQRISAMESSKFWILRQKWFKLKKTFGLSADE